MWIVEVFKFINIIQVHTHLQKIQFNFKLFFFLIAQKILFYLRLKFLHSLHNSLHEACIAHCITHTERTLATLIHSLGQTWHLS